MRAEVSEGGEDCGESLWREKVMREGGEGRWCSSPGSSYVYETR